MYRIVARWPAKRLGGNPPPESWWEGGHKRRGDEYTIPLSSWHHRGVLLPGHTASSMRLLYGPSLALHSKAFRQRYGRDDELLDKVNDLIRMRDEMAFGWAHVTEAQRSVE